MYLQSSNPFLNQSYAKFMSNAAKLQTQNQSSFVQIANDDSTNFKIDKNLVGSKKYKAYKKYKNNPDFQKLLKSSFFSGPEGAAKLVGIIYELDKTQQEAYKKVNSWGYTCIITPDTTRMRANISVDKCIGNLNKFFNSKLPDDIKQNMLNEKSNLTDLWYVSHNLEYLNPDKPELSTLNTKFYAL